MLRNVDAKYLLYVISLTSIDAFQSWRYRTAFTSQSKHVKNTIKILYFYPQTFEVKSK